MERLCCESFFKNSSRVNQTVRLIEVFALENVCFREVLPYIYYSSNLLLQNQPPEVFCKKNLFRSATLLKRDSNTGVCFTEKFVKFLRTSILKNIFERLLLIAGLFLFLQIISFHEHVSKGLKNIIFSN